MWLQIKIDWLYNCYTIKLHAKYENLYELIDVLLCSARDNRNANKLRKMIYTVNVYIILSSSAATVYPLLQHNSYMSLIDTCV